MTTPATLFLLAASLISRLAIGLWLPWPWLSRGIDRLIWPGGGGRRTGFLKPVAAQANPLRLPARFVRSPSAKREYLAPVNRFHLAAKPAKRDSLGREFSPQVATIREGWRKAFRIGSHQTSTGYRGWRK